MQNHPTSEFTLAVVPVALGAGQIVEWLFKIGALLEHAESLLASLSYLVAIIAGVYTIWLKWKHRKDK